MNWRAFTDEAFREGRPVLLLLTTRTSHACHLLDVEALDDPEVAAALEDRFVPVRVDADDRPDIDARYQPAAIPSYPLACVIAPEGTLLGRTPHLTGSRLGALLAGATGEAPSDPVPSDAPVDPAAQLARLRASFRLPFGGYSPPPKHPHAPLLDLLLTVSDAGALHTLDAISRGGLHDQLAGGFHRYSTDDKWIVPHFEKRAADQAALLVTYLDAYRRTGEARYREVALGIVRFVAARLADPAGGWFAAEDADIGAYDDGSHYTFTVDEARAALPDPDVFAVAQRTWDIFGRGELHSDPTRNVLFLTAAPADVAAELRRSEPEVAALLERAKAGLLAARAARPQPPIDTAKHVSTNAHLCRAHLDAATTLGLPACREVALTALAALYRTPPRPLLDDHAQLGLAALAAHTATGDSAHRAVAVERCEQLLADYWDETAQAFCDRPRGAPGPAALARPLHPVRDGAAQSGNALAGQLLGALGDTDRARALARALLPRAAAEGASGAGLIQLALTASDT
ncbi:MAG TPA: DUF255 domain-containing protein [Kofleriaceae bacterium]|nr:DUF255 domain-containing protein [Kofleriaceae bacterium]